MKLRVAKTIREAVGTPRESAYSERQIEIALRRTEKMRDVREGRNLFFAYCEAIGPVGRAERLAKDGFPDEALRLLMAADEASWDPSPVALRAFGELCERYRREDNGEQRRKR